MQGPLRMPHPACQPTIGTPATLTPLLQRPVLKHSSAPLVSSACTSAPNAPNAWTLYALLPAASGAARLPPLPVLLLLPVLPPDAPTELLAIVLPL